MSSRGQRTTIGVVAAIITIFVFSTGIPDLPSLLNINKNSPISSDSLVNESNAQEDKSKDKNESSAKVFVDTGIIEDNLVSVIDGERNVIMSGNLDFIRNLKISPNNKKFAFEYPHHHGDHRIVISNVDGDKIQEYSLECKNSSSSTSVKNLVWVSSQKLRGLFEGYYNECNLKIEDIPLENNDGYYDIEIDSLNTILNAKSIR